MLLNINTCGPHMNLNSVQIIPLFEFTMMPALTYQTVNDNEICMKL